MICKRGNLRKNRWDAVCRRHPDWKDKEDTPQMGDTGLRRVTTLEEEFSFPQWEILCHTSTPQTALQHDRGFKLLTPPRLTKNFKEIKCCLVNCPFLPPPDFSLTSTNSQYRTLYEERKGRMRGKARERKAWVNKRTGKKPEITEKMALSISHILSYSFKKVTIQ